MSTRNIHDQIKAFNILSLWRKIFSVFLVLFLQNLIAQISISDETKLYVSNGTIIYEANAEPEKIVAKGKIFVFGETKIYQKNSENNFEIVQQKTSQEKSKKEYTLKIAQIQKEKKQKEKIASVKTSINNKKDFFSNQKSETYFSFSASFSKISVPVSQFNAKQIISSENDNTSLSYRWSKMASEHFKSAELLTAQNKSAFSVRPPPFLV